MGRITHKITHCSLNKEGKTLTMTMLSLNTNTLGLISSLDFNYECNKFGILGLE